MDFEQAKKVLQPTETRIKEFDSIDTVTRDEIQKAIFRFQPFQRLVIAHHAQEALTRLREQTVPLANSLEQLIATAINLNHAEFREFADPGHVSAETQSQTSTRTQWAGVARDREF